MNKKMLWCLCGLSLVACSKSETVSEGPRPAVVITVQDGVEAGLRAYSGEVRARHEVDLGFRIGGKIVERPVTLGQRVTKGQVLARLDPQDVRLSADAAAAQVAAAEADLKLAQAEFERAQRMVEQKFISASVLDSRRTQFEAARSRLEQARAQQGVSRNQLDYAQLNASMDGVVTATPADAGQVVGAGQAVVRLADPREIEVLIWVPESRVSEVQVGMPAFVRPWSAQDKTLAGKVREVAASADSTTRTYAVRVAVAQPEGALSLGATAGVAFPQTEGKAGVTLPLPAVVRKQDAAYVWVVGADGTPTQRAVELAGWRDQTVTIRSGLKAGDKVVTVGAHTVVPGMKLRPVEQAAPVALDVSR